MEGKMKEVLQKLDECHQLMQGTNNVLVMLFGVDSTDSSTPNCLISKYGSCSAIAYFIERLISETEGLAEELLLLKLSKMFKGEKEEMKTINKVAI